MIETLLIELAKQVPALVVLVWLVHRFLSYLKTQNEFLKTAQTECHKVTKEVTKESNEAIRESARALGGLQTVLDKLNGKKLEGANERP